MENLETDINSYLSFKLGDEEFAAHVKSVLNILEMTRITKVPKSPSYMKGVINLRGKVLPIIDSRVKFGLEEINHTDKTCIVVMEVSIEDQKTLIGSLVDEVVSVIEFDKSEILPPPSIGSKYKSEFIEGMVKVDEKFIMILDVDKVFTESDLSILKEKSEKVEINK